MLRGEEWKGPGGDISPVPLRGFGFLCHTHSDVRVNVGKGNDRWKRLGALDSESDPRPQVTHGEVGLRYLRAFVTNEMRTAVKSAYVSFNFSEFL